MTAGGGGEYDARMAQTLTEIKTLLAAYGLQPKKRFGQNFLHDGNHMAKILAAAGLGGDASAVGEWPLVLEVGPGTGALTERLIDAGARVVAVEIDGDMEPIIRDRLGPAMAEGRLTLHIGDALDGKHAINPQVLALLDQSDASRVASRSVPYKLIANLPYNIASPLLVNLALDHPAMSGAVVMVQKEVADRMAGTPADGKAYGPLGIILQAVFTVERVCVLSPGCFYPPPSIASAVVKLTRRAMPLCDAPHAFAGFVHRLFGRRRKQLGAILGRDTPLPPDLSPQARPETLSVEQLVALARWIDRHVPNP